MGGLTCAYILQKHGFDVTVLEQGIQAGGCLQCFTRGGVQFETGMHFIGSALPGQTMNLLLQYLGLSESVKLDQMNTAAYNTISLEGERFSIPNGREPFLETMSERFPSQKDAIKKYLDIVDQIAAASTLKSLTSQTRDLTANTEYQTRSMNEVLDELFTDKLLRNVIAGDLPLYCAERDKTPFSQHAFVMDFYNNSAFRIAGGSDTIAKSLIENITAMGGEVLTRKKVTKIICDDVKATGVVTSDECHYAADYIISTIHPMRLLELLDTKLIRPAFRTRINGIPQTSGVFAVYVKFKENTVPYMNTNFYGYKTDSPWDCEHYTQDEWPKGFLYMHMCSHQNQTWAKSGVILAYMNFDEVQKWQGTRIAHRGEDYEAFKRRKAEILLAEVENQCPGFLDGVQDWWTSTPLTYMDYTGTQSGSIYGIAKDVNAGPAGRVPYRTKIPNLLLAGQNVNSHGMLGVLVGTIVTCSELIPASTIFNDINF